MSRKPESELDGESIVRVCRKCLMDLISYSVLRYFGLMDIVNPRKSCFISPSTNESVLWSASMAVMLFLSSLGMRDIRRMIE